jgi:hypothetical protein
MSVSAAVLVAALSLMAVVLAGLDQDQAVTEPGSPTQSQARDLSLRFLSHSPQAARTQPGLRHQPSNARTSLTMPQNDTTQIALRR